MSVYVCRCYTHPVVREVLVDNLPHLSLLGVQDVRGKVQDHVQHGCLRRQSSAAVFRGGVAGDLVVDVI